MRSQMINAAKANNDYESERPSKRQRNAITSQTLVLEPTPDLPECNYTPRHSLPQSYVEEQILQSPKSPPPEDSDSGSEEDEKEQQENIREEPPAPTQASTPTLLFPPPHLPSPNDQKWTPLEQFSGALAHPPWRKLPRKYYPKFIQPYSQCPGHLKRKREDHAMKSKDISVVNWFYNPNPKHHRVILPQDDPLLFARTIPQSFHCDDRFGTPPSGPGIYHPFRITCLDEREAVTEAIGDMQWAWADTETSRRGDLEEYIYETTMNDRIKPLGGYKAYVLRKASRSSPWNRNGKDHYRVAKGVKERIGLIRRAERQRLMVLGKKLERYEFRDPDEEGSKLKIVTNIDDFEAEIEEESRGGSGLAEDKIDPFHTEEDEEELWSIINSEDDSGEESEVSAPITTNTNQYVDGNEGEEEYEPALAGDSSSDLGEEVRLINPTTPKPHTPTPPPPPTPTSTQS